jgi:hypothetical protein
VVASAEPAIGAVDAIVVEVSQTVTIAAPGLEAGSSEEPETTGSIAVPPAAAPTADANDPNDLDD